MCLVLFSTSFRWFIFFFLSLCLSPLTFLRWSKISGVFCKHRRSNLYPEAFLCFPARLLRGPVNTLLSCQHVWGVWLEKLRLMHRIGLFFFCFFLKVQNISCDDSSRHVNLALNSLYQQKYLFCTNGLKLYIFLDILLSNVNNFPGFVKIFPSFMLNITDLISFYYNLCTRSSAEWYCLFTDFTIFFTILLNVLPQWM